MARSSWKFNHTNSNFFKIFFPSKLKTVKLLKTFSRNITITQFFLKKSVAVYKGNLFNKVLFTKYHLGFKTGEFSITKKPFNYPLKTKVVGKIKR